MSDTNHDIVYVSEPGETEKLFYQLVQHYLTEALKHFEDPSDPHKAKFTHLSNIITNTLKEPSMRMQEPVARLGTILNTAAMPLRTKGLKEPGYAKALAFIRKPSKREDDLENEATGPRWKERFLQRVQQGGSKFDMLKLVDELIPHLIGAELFTAIAHPPVDAKPTQPLAIDPNPKTLAIPSRSPYKGYSLGKLSEMMAGQGVEDKEPAPSKKPKLRMPAVIKAPAAAEPAAADPVAPETVPTAQPSVIAPTVEQLINRKEPALPRKKRSYDAKPGRVRGTFQPVGIWSQFQDGVKVLRGIVGMEDEDGFFAAHNIHYQSPLGKLLSYTNYNPITHRLLSPEVQADMLALANKVTGSDQSMIIDAMMSQMRDQIDYDRKIAEPADLDRAV